MKINFIDMSGEINKDLQECSVWKDCTKGDVLLNEKNGEMVVFIEQLTVSGAKLLKISKESMIWHLGTAFDPLKKIGKIKI